MLQVVSCQGGLPLASRLSGAGALMRILEQFRECLLLLPGCRRMSGLSKRPLALSAGSRPPTPSPALQPEEPL